MALLARSLCGLSCFCPSACVVAADEYDPGLRPRAAGRLRRRGGSLSGRAYRRSPRMYRRCSAWSECCCPSTGAPTFCRRPAPRLRPRRRARPSTASPSEPGPPPISRTACAASPSGGPGSRRPKKPRTASGALPSLQRQNRSAARSRVPARPRAPGPARCHGGGDGPAVSGGSGLPQRASRVAPGGAPAAGLSRHRRLDTGAGSGGGRPELLRLLGRDSDLTARRIRSRPRGPAGATRLGGLPGSNGGPAGRSGPGDNGASRLSGSAPRRCGAREPRRTEGMVLEAIARAIARGRRPRASRLEAAQAYTAAGDRAAARRMLAGLADDSGGARVGRVRRGDSR